MKRKVDIGAVGTDFSFDQKKIRDASSLYARVQAPHGQRVAKTSPDSGAMNATYGGPSRNVKPGFGPNGPGHASKKSGADYGFGLKVKTGQDDS
jgi:hypothetical protein